MQTVNFSIKKFIQKSSQKSFKFHKFLENIRVKFFSVLILYT